jgi:hypothetical protein
MLGCFVAWVCNLKWFDSCCFTVRWLGVGAVPLKTSVDP